MLLFYQWIDSDWCSCLMGRIGPCYDSSSGWYRRLKKCNFSNFPLYMLVLTSNSTKYGTIGILLLPSCQWAHISHRPIQELDLFPKKLAIFHWKSLSKKINSWRIHWPLGAPIGKRVTAAFQWYSDRIRSECKHLRRKIPKKWHSFTSPSQFSTLL